MAGCLLLVVELILVVLAPPIGLTLLALTIIGMVLIVLLRGVGSLARLGLPASPEKRAAQRRARLARYYAEKDQEP